MDHTREAVSSYRTREGHKVWVKTREVFQELNIFKHNLEFVKKKTDKIISQTSNSKR